MPFTPVKLETNHIASYLQLPNLYVNFSRHIYYLLSSIWFFALILHII